MSGSVREEKGRLVVSLDGEIDLDRAPEVRKLLLDCTARGQDVLVDLSGVGYIDSSGIASLVEALKSAQTAGRAFGLVSISGATLRVFELARLDKVFTIHDDLSAALAGGTG